MECKRRKTTPITQNLFYSRNGLFRVFVREGKRNRLLQYEKRLFESVKN